MTGLNAKPTRGARNHKCQFCGKPSMYYFDDGRGWRCGNHWKTGLIKKFQDKQPKL